jgi:hypothetical protein
MSAAAAGGPESAPPWSAGPPVPPGLQVVHADDALLVFDKPAGLLAVPGRGEDKQDCLAARAQAALSRRPGGAPARHGHLRPDRDGPWPGRAARAQPRLRKAPGAQTVRRGGAGSAGTARDRRRLGTDRPAPDPGLAEPPAQHRRSRAGAAQPHPLARAGARRGCGHHPRAAGARHRTLAPVARASAGAGPSHRGRSALCACPGNWLFQPPAAARAASGTVSPGHRPMPMVFDSAAPF